MGVDEELLEAEVHSFLEWCSLSSGCVLEAYCAVSGGTCMSEGQWLILSIFLGFLQDWPWSYRHKLPKRLESATEPHMEQMLVNE